MIKVFLDPISGNILKYEPLEYIEKILDFEMSDIIVVDEKTGEILRLQDSTQGKKRLNELKSKKHLSFYEEAELEANKFLESL